MVTYEIGDIVKLKECEGTFIIVTILPNGKYEVRKEDTGANINDPSGNLIVKSKDIESTEESAKERKFKVLFFKNVLDENERFAEIWESFTSEEQLEYKKYFDSHNREEFVSNPSFYGTPETIPPTFDVAMRRSEYPDMEGYKDFKNKYIVPLVNELKFQSFAELESKKLKYNDREIGTFDFTKASVNLLKSYVYYSPKHNKFLNEKEVAIKKIGSGYRYFYKKDNSPVILKEKLNEKGKKEFYSTIKKVYLSHEVVPKPYKAVRIFSPIGYNASYITAAGDSMPIDAGHFIYSGFMCMSMIEIFEEFGYIVNFNAIDTGLFQSTNENNNPAEYYYVTSLKGFNDQLYTPACLYKLSDASFYRLKAFKNAACICMTEGVQDKGYGQSVVKQDRIKECIYRTFIPRDAHADILYFFVPQVPPKLHGNLEGILQFIREAIRTVLIEAEDENKKARESFMDKTK